MWTPDGDTLGNAPITISGNNSTFAGEITATNIYAETYRSSRTDGEIYIQAATASDFVSIGTQVANNLMRIEGGGNVGIGSTSPQVKLHVEGRIRSTYNGDTAWYSGNYVRLFNSQAFGFLNSSGSSIAEINLNGNSYFNGGNVGIGTTSPNNKLDVNGDVFINSNYTANVAAQDLTIGKTTTGNHGLTIVTGPTYTGSIYFGDSGNNDAGIIKYQHSNNSMQFVTNRSEAMRIDTSGNGRIVTGKP